MQNRASLERCAHDLGISCRHRSRYPIVGSSHAPQGIQVACHVHMTCQGLGERLCQLITSSRLLKSADHHHFSAPTVTTSPFFHAVETLDRSCGGVTMLTTSLRNAVRTSAVSLASVNPAASAAVAVPKLLETASHGLHQRRYSSSKPPVPPNDGSRPIDTSSQTPAKGVSPTGQKRDGKAAKRRAKESRRSGSGKSSQSSAFLNLPSVPSTQHLQPQGLFICNIH